jgi:hypothetical protein
MSELGIEGELEVRGDIANKISYIQNAFSGCLGLVYFLNPKEEIKTQHDYSKFCFPGYETNKKGFAINKKDIWSFFDRKIPFGPLSRHDYGMNLCGCSTHQWNGRIEELNQYNFQMSLVGNGLMRKPR